jgi:hypothetical protein
LLKGAVSSLVLTYTGPLLRATVEATDDGFMPLAHSTADQLLVPPGYEAQILIRWGDPIIADTPGFDLRGQTAAKQARQFGYNNDFVGFLPLPFGTHNSDHGLLVVNQEFTNAELMFADWDGKLENKTREMVDIEIAAHGLAIIEVQRNSKGIWSYKVDSPYNRRLTAESPMALSGPAAGHPWLKTSYDSTGTLVCGTLNNCAAGTTPWEAVLTAEENFDTYFTAVIDKPLDASVQAIHKRYGLRDRYGWARFHDRFDVAKEPHEPLRFGWVVAVDPYAPRSIPVKRTALGRTKP